ncbi:lytic transglycosylase domain-containing protein [Aeromicrobium wangtongii]|uniref:Lytic transglycosylase domain-containing protein n=1 Tax=Aeromicrobium wangtongii TaxID=2969247 RepID=A0ABY5M973_9ACTN|nr:lytic murein transglycosylase [Aeromicrobium wangtongii]MCD9200059.1 lytic transglycosylase domain-containing protein [Aeromicrobium wangtongii]UUP13317.1 lytic transglycosylase domain-containing protein [Aeromicrobium wangtongii]
MGVRQLTRWQKASALVPMAVLVGAWGAAIGNSGLATASDGPSDGAVPDVPSTAFEQPASVQQTPAGVDAKAGAAGTVATLSTNGIPTAALNAYRRSETLLGKADKVCNLQWNLVAAIGRVESNHGRSGGNALDGDGIAQPGIFGVPLDGKDGRANIGDTDSGELDNNSVYDLAVGPMQFIPGTWKSVGVDADNDGDKNPQSINDAATSAGIYLCAGEGDLSDPSVAAAAVKRYNNSDAYVDLVLKISAAYANGDFTQSPNGVSAAPVLTRSADDQTLTPAQRKKAANAQKSTEKKKSVAKPGAGGTKGGGSGGGTKITPIPAPGAGGSGSGGGGNGSGGGSGGGGGGTTKPAPGTLGGGVQDLVEDTPLSPLAPVTKPVTGLLTLVEAIPRCTALASAGPSAAYPSTKYMERYNACIKELTGKK